MQRKKMRQLLNVFKIDNTLSWDVYVKCIAKKTVKKNFQCLEK